MSKPSKEQLAQMLREYPTWGHAAVAEKERAEQAYKLLLDVEGSILAYWTDISQVELQRLQAAIRAFLGGWEPVTPEAERLMNDPHGSDFPSEPGAGDAAQVADGRPGEGQERQPVNMSDPYGGEFSDEALERLAQDLRCGAISANNEFVVCQRRMGHPLGRREAHVGVDLEGVTYEFRQVVLSTPEAEEER